MEFEENSEVERNREGRLKEIQQTTDPVSSSTNFFSNDLILLPSLSTDWE
jgi:hypothetical protein